MKISRVLLELMAVSLQDACANYSALSSPLASCGAAGEQKAEMPEEG